jgi:hypothetical protein
MTAFRIKSIFSASAGGIGASGPGMVISGVALGTGGG